MLKETMFAAVNVAYSASIYMTPKAAAEIHFHLPPIAVFANQQREHKCCNGEQYQEEHNTIT